MLYRGIGLVLISTAIIFALVFFSDDSEADGNEEKIVFNPDEINVVYGGLSINESPIEITLPGKSLVVTPKTGYHNLTINGDQYEPGTSVVITSSLKSSGVLIQSEKIHYSIMFKESELDEITSVRDNILIDSSFSFPYDLYSKSGYSIVEWNTNENGNGFGINENTIVIDGDTIDALFGGNQTVTLYPIWSTLHYTIKLDTSIGSVTGDGWSNVDGSFVKDYTIMDEITLPRPVTDDRFHTFICWEDQNGVTVTKISGKYENISLKAVWADTEFKINTYVNGKKTEIPLTIGSEMPSPDCEYGFRFVGWFYEDENGTEKEFTSMSQMYEGMSINAVFEPIEEDPVQMGLCVGGMAAFFAAVMIIALRKR